MIAWKYWLAMFGWKLNAYFHALGLTRLPLFRSIWSTAKFSMAELLASRHGILANIGGQPIYIHPFTFVYAAKRYEPYTTELFQRVLKPGFTVLDIGANLGYFSLIAARYVGREGRVYAFEPAPKNFQILKTNIELNGFTNIYAVNKAVADKRAHAPFYITEDSGHHSMHNPIDPFKSIISVECVTIDDFLRDKTIDVIKMDIEGSEVYAIEGMVKTLSQSKKVVLFVELNPPLLRRAGVEPEAFLGRLEQLGFEYRLINEETKSLQLIKTEEVQQLTRYANLYCVKRYSVNENSVDNTPC